MKSFKFKGVIFYFEQIIMPQSLYFKHKYIFKSNQYVYYLFLNHIAPIGYIEYLSFNRNYNNYKYKFDIYGYAADQQPVIHLKRKDLYEHFYFSPSLEDIKRKQKIKLMLR